MIDKELLDKCKKMTAEDSMMRSLGCALSKTDLMDAAYDANAGRKLTMDFSIDLCSSKVTNQKSSGRCWIFAAMNVLREAAAKNCGMESMELSQNYIAFWDKFETVSYTHLYQIAENAGYNGDDIVAMQKAAKPNVGFDAKLGQWVDMFSAGIIDPAKVTKSALLNAASIAALFLTTEAAVAELPEKKEPIAPPMDY